ncbi:MAG TPA: PD-(D/E)XK nuclease family protein, partial [Pyrinomonadaceae bacterium]|nr:PD-(D/E)XK nuclease family protein [Pyrinomonadaceae bacterium]
TESSTSMTTALKTTSEDYELQMQSYALAVRELIPALSGNQIRATLHFLQPNVEVHLSDELLKPAQCQAAVDAAMLRIVSSADPVDFPVKPAPHCRTCSFLSLCSAGRQFLATST